MSRSVKSRFVDLSDESSVVKLVHTTIVVLYISPARPRFGLETVAGYRGTEKVVS